MEKNSNNLKKELFELEEVLYECESMLKNGIHYQEMKLEGLFSLYDRIENGLIGYNFLVKKDPNLLEQLISKLTTRKTDESCKLVGKFLEAQLLTVVVNIVAKNKNEKDKEITFKKFKQSLWGQKIKNKNYYLQVFELAGIKPEYKDKLYSLLQEK
jgi:hypothetical protein